MPVLDDAALTGPVGDAVRIIEPSTEGAPVIVLAAMLTGLGAMLGRRPYVPVEDRVQARANLFVVVVGESAKARKDTATKAADGVLDLVGPTFGRSRVMGGFGSGQSLTDAVRDDTDDDTPRDKRVLMRESEFASVLAACRGQESTLSQTIRKAWDGGPLEARSRTGGTVVATGHHVAVVASITREELVARLTGVDLMSGFANRFVYLAAARSKSLPFHIPAATDRLAPLAARIAANVDRGRHLDAVDYTPAARDRWQDIYRTLGDDDPPGLLGAVVARDAMHVRKLALVYALTAGRDAIDVADLDAAEAIWNYARATATWIWPDDITPAGGVSPARLLAAIRAAPDGLTLTEQHAKFGRASAAALARARRHLLDTEQIVERARPSGGRPATVHVVAGPPVPGITNNPRP